MGITPFSAAFPNTFFTATFCTVRMTKNGSTDASFFPPLALSYGMHVLEAYDETPSWMKPPRRGAHRDIG